MSFLLTSTFACDANKESVVTYEEQNGRVAVEAEHFSTQRLNSIREWIVVDQQYDQRIQPDPDANHAATASGSAYLEALPDTRTTHADDLMAGENFSSEPGRIAVLDYQIYFNSPGRYYVWVRAYSTGTEDNSIHVGLNGEWVKSGQRMQWCEGKDQWTWASKQRTETVHCGVKQQIYLDVTQVGIHTVSFSMREDGFEFDKFLLDTVYTKPVGVGMEEILHKSRE